MQSRYWSLVVLYCLLFNVYPCLLFCNIHKVSVYKPWRILSGWLTLNNYISYNQEMHVWYWILRSTLNKFYLSFTSTVQWFHHPVKFKRWLATTAPPKPFFLFSAGSTLITSGITRALLVGCGGDERFSRLDLYGWVR